MWDDFSGLLEGPGFTQTHNPLCIVMPLSGQRLIRHIQHGVGDERGVVGRGRGCRGVALAVYGDRPEGVWCEGVATVQCWQRDALEFSCGAEIASGLAWGVPQGAKGRERDLELLHS